MRQTLGDICQRFFFLLDSGLKRHQLQSGRAVASVGWPVPLCWTSLAMRSWWASSRTLGLQVHRLEGHTPPEESGGHPHWAAEGPALLTAVQLSALFWSWVGLGKVRSPPLARPPLLFTAETANTCWEAVLLAWLLPLGMENGAFFPSGLGQGTYLPAVSWGWPQPAPAWMLGAEEPTLPQRCPGPEQQLVPSRGL